MSPKLIEVKESVCACGDGAGRKESEVSRTQSVDVEQG